MSEPIRVDIWSDIACPLCYIGKRRLEAGVAAFSSRPASPPVEIEYHSFQLSPETPVDFEGSEIDFLVAHKRLTEPQVKVMIDRVSSVPFHVIDGMFGLSGAHPAEAFTDALAQAAAARAEVVA